MPEEKRGVSGTKEWSVASVNCAQGCYNGCYYCYAREMAVRFGRVLDHEEWQSNVRVKRKPGQETRKYPGTVMFPTTHDITPSLLQPSFEVLRNLLTAGNDVLVVSKPSLYCIEALCRGLDRWKHQILFRFTIGCLDGDTMRMWEPMASPPVERLACLHLARSLGYRTSVSMEPMLRADNVVEDFPIIARDVTDSVWLGKMNHVRKRVVIQKRALLEGGEVSIIEKGVPLKEVERIERAQTDDNIRRIYKALKDEPKVRWKENIKKVVGLPVDTEPGLDR